MWLKRIFAISLVGVLLTYLPMLMWALPDLARESAGELPFDFRWSGYSPDDARAFLSTLTETGRAIYLGPFAWLDAALPAFLLLTIGSALLLSKSRLWAWIGVLAALGFWGADYVENSGVADVLRTPLAEVTDAQIILLSYATQLKFAALGLAVICLIIALLARLSRRMKAL